MLASLGLSSIRTAVMQTHRSLLWTCLWRNTGVLNIWNPFLIWHKGQCDKSDQAPMHLSIRGATPKTESCRLDLDFGWHFLAPYLPRWIVPVMRGIFLCIHMGWGKCPLLSAVVSWPDTRLGVGKGVAVGLEAGAEHNYPTSATFHHFMHRDCYPVALTPGCLFFFPFLLLFFLNYFLGGI